MTFSRALLDEIVLVLENEFAFYKRYSNKAENTYGKRRAVIGQFLGFPGSGGDRPRAWHNNTIEDREQLRRYFDARYEIPQDEGAGKYADLPDIWKNPEPPPPPTLNPRYKPLVTKIMELGIGSKWETTSNQLAYASSLASHFGYCVADIDLKLVIAEVTRLRNASPCPPGYGDLCQKKPDMPTFYNPTALKALTKEDRTMTAIKTAIKITTKTFANGEDIATMADSDIYDLIARQEAAIKELEKIETKPKKLVAEITERREGITALVAYLDSKTA